MGTRRAVAVLGGGAIVALAVALSPALGAASSRSVMFKPRVLLSARGGLGSFTPAASDSRLAASLAHSSLISSGFRFTPSVATVRLNRSVTVAVRARTSGAALSGERTALVAAPTGTAISPLAYNLGVAVGWKRFALSSDMAKVDLGALGGREAVDVGVSYNTRKWTARVAAAADRPTTGTPRALSEGTGYSVDFGGSYSLTRNLDVTAGVRYRATENQRLLPQVDNRRDSQAVYVGTAFKF